MENTIEATILTFNQDKSLAPQTGTPQLTTHTAHTAHDTHGTQW
jgi:hypothetical protein